MKWLSNIFMKRSNWSIPYFIFLLIFVVLPLALIFLYAFQNAEGEFTLKNFSKFISSPEAANTFVYSIGVAIITTALCILLGYPAAYILSNSELCRSKVTVVLFILPMWINILVRTLATVALFDFMKFPLGEGALIFGMVYNFLPFMILQINTSLCKMDHSLIEAAADLGATGAQTFRRVIFPLSLPGVINGITLVFLPAVSSFFIPKLLGGGQYFLIGNLIENQFITAGEWNFGSAISMIMAIVMMLMMMAVRNVEKRNQGGKEDK